MRLSQNQDRLLSPNPDRPRSRNRALHPSLNIGQLRSRSHVQPRSLNTGRLLSLSHDRPRSLSHNLDPPHNLRLKRAASPSNAANLQLSVQSKRPA